MTSFDNVGVALLTLWKVVTVGDWSETFGWVRLALLSRGLACIGFALR